MFCVKCGKEVKDGTKFCTNCGAEIEAKKEEVKDDKLTYSQNKTIETNTNTTVAASTEKTGDGKGTASVVLGIISLVVWCVTPITSIIGLILGICSKKSGKKTAGIILNAIALGLSIIGIILCFSFGWFAALVGETPDTPITPVVPVNPVRPATGSKVVFDNYEITLGNNYSIITDEKSSSRHYGIKVIKLPATIKNLGTSRSHLNMYYHYYYGPNGNKLDKLNSDFTSVDDAIDYVYVDPNESKLQYFYIPYDGAGKYKIEFKKYNEEKTIEFTIK